MPTYRLLLPLLTGALAAQAVVVPPAAAARDGSSNCSVAGFVGRYRQQVLIGGDLLRPAIGRSITSLTLRRDGAAPPLSSGAARLTVRIGPTPFATLEAVSARFDDNLGSVGRLVFDGVIQMPAAPRLPQRNAATWSLPDAITVALTSPYAYPGGTLCVEIEGEPVAGNSSDWWPVDAESDGVRGRRSIVGTGCGAVAANANHTATVNERELRANATARLLHLAEMQALTVAGIAAHDLTTPIELAPIGAPGCWLYILPDITLPVAVRGDPLGRGIGGALLPLRIPNAPMSLGATLHVQWFDVTTNGVAVSNATKLEIASSALGLNAAMVTSRRTDVGAFPSEGRVDMGVMPVLRLDLQ